MTDLLRCPFCESQIPREALYCSRCGGKIPRTTPQGTAPGIAPRMPTPAPEASPVASDPPAEADGVGATAPGVGAAAPGSSAVSPSASGSAAATPAAARVRAGASAPAPSSSSMSMSSPSQSMSLSSIRRPAWGLRIALVLVGAGVCAAAGWWFGRSQSTEPIAAVTAPPIVELGQPRVAVGEDVPDPTRFLDPVPDGGAAPEATRGGGGGGGGGGGSKTRPGAATPTNSRPAGGGSAPAGGGGGGGGSPAPAAGGGGGGGSGATEPAGGTGGTGAEAPAPDPPTDEPDDSGQLDTRAVIYVVRHYLPQVRSCYERQLRNQPELGGQITMRFTVGTAGRVTDTSVVVNSTGSSELAACVAANLRTWHFPQPEGGPVAFEYPFRFGSPAAAPQFPGATQDP